MDNYDQKPTIAPKSAANEDCDGKVTWEFRLYVAGNTPNSRLAVSNLRTIARVYLDNCVRIEVIDVLEEPTRVIEDDIIVTPTLVRMSPGPVRKIIGNLNDFQQIILSLDL